MKYSTHICLWLILFLVASCGVKYKGSIIKKGPCNRIATWEGADEAKQQFLVNTSTSEVITFTLRQINRSRLDRYDNKLYEISTETRTKTYTLNPGEEVQLSCEKYFFYNDKEKWDEYKYEIIGAVLEKK